MTLRRRQRGAQQLQSSVRAKRAKTGHVDRTRVECAHRLDTLLHGCDLGGDDGAASQCHDGKLVLLVESLLGPDLNMIRI